MYHGYIYWAYRFLSQDDWSVALDDWNAIPTPETRDTTGCRNAKRGSFVDFWWIFPCLCCGGGVSVQVKAKLERVTTYLINSWVMGVASCVRLQVGCWYFFTPPPKKKYIISQQILLVDAVLSRLFVPFSHQENIRIRASLMNPEDANRLKAANWHEETEGFLMTEISWCCRNIGKWNFSDQYRGGEMHDGMFIKPPSAEFLKYMHYIRMITYMYIYIYEWYMIYECTYYIVPAHDRGCVGLFIHLYLFFLTKPFFSGLAGEKRAGEEEGVGGVSWQSQRATGVAGGIWQVAKCFWMAGVSLEYHLQNLVPQVWPLDEWTMRFTKYVYIYICIIYRVTQPPYPNELLKEGFKIFFV